MSGAELELPDPVDLVLPTAQPARREPLVVDGQVVATPYLSPLDIDPVTHLYPTELRGGVVTSLAAIEAIRRRVEYGALPWWRRAITRTPPGWRPGTRPLGRRTRAVPHVRPLELSMIPTVACRECGTEAPNDEACGDPCCSRCSHPAKAVG